MVAFAVAADVLEVFFEVVLDFFDEVDAFFVEIGDAFAVEVVLTVEDFRVEVVLIEVVALLTTSMPSWALT